MIFQLEILGGFCVLGLFHGMVLWDDPKSTYSGNMIHLLHVFLEEGRMVLGIRFGRMPSLGPSFVAQAPAGTLGAMSHGNSVQEWLK